MVALYIEPTASTPLYHFDPEAGRLVISGESYPENAAAFYEPLLDHIGKWLATANPVVFEVEFALRYYNSSSSKAIMNLLDLLEKASTASKIRVHWRYEPENDIIQESGEEFQEDYEKLDFRLETITTDG